MARLKAVYECSSCGWQSPKWMGQCRDCAAWGTLEEFVPSTAATSPGASSAARWSGTIQASPLSEVRDDDVAVHPTGVAEFDRVLGGGIVPGSVVLLAGDPGVGKSTLLLDVAARFAASAHESGGGPVLYVTGEESAGQVRRRGQRIGAANEHLLLASLNDADAIEHLVDQHRPSLLIVDSVQTVSTQTVDSQPGSVGQIKAVTQGIIRACKPRGIPALVVGHVNKDGAIAGPRTLEHLVDVVCQFEGDRNTPLRLLRTVKNRYGSTDEVGCFVLEDKGIVQVEDPSSLFTSGARGQSPGSFITVSLEGNRPMLTEVQALVVDGGGKPRRVTSGLDSARMSMLVAVTDKQFNLHLGTKEVYISTVGGARSTEPAVDLAAALAIVSTARNKVPKANTIALGEVGLTGEIRGAASLSRRLNEAARLGWKNAIVPASAFVDVKPPAGMKVQAVSTLGEAVGFAF